MEEILGLARMSKFDYYSRPLREIFSNTPDLTPYFALRSHQPLNEMNPARTESARASQRLDLDRVDAADETAFNHVLWNLLKGSQPYPGTKRMSSLEMVRAR
jgi:hypothetical protein